MKCNECKVETTNPKFCGNSCAAIYNNRHVTRKVKKKQWKCKFCDMDTPSRRTICDGCTTHGRLGDLTLREAIYAQHHKSSAYALVRSRARKSKEKCPCEKCGYSKHTEVCHIKAISEFDENTMISDINSLDNLLRLCPNCH